MTPVRKTDVLPMQAPEQQPVVKKKIKLIKNVVPIAAPAPTTIGQAQAETTTCQTEQLYEDQRQLMQKHVDDGIEEMGPAAREVPEQAS